MPQEIGPYSAIIDKLRSSGQTFENNTIGPDSDIINKIRVALSGSNAGRSFLNIVDNIPEDIKNIGPADTSTARVPLTLLENDSALVSKLAKYLQDTVNVAKGLDFETSSKVQNQLKKLVETNPLVHKYMDTLNAWTGGSYGEMRRALAYPNTGQDLVTRELAAALADLYEASPNITKQTLLRTSSLAEIPKLEVGATFDNPFLSFSNLNKVDSAGHTIALESGAKTLPISGYSTWGSQEAEHITGGKFTIQDLKEYITKWGQSRKLVKIKQTNPNIR